MNEERANTGIEQLLSSISIASVRTGFERYRHTWKMVLRHQGSFISITAASEPKSLTLGPALSIFLYGIALCFMLYIPIIVQNDLAIDKVYFLLQFLYLQCILVLLIYLSAKIFLGRGTLEKTAASYLIYIGVLAPFFMLISYPIFLYEPIVDFVGGSSPPQYEESSNFAVGTPMWAEIWAGLVLILMLIVGFRIGFRWLAEVHQITRKRLFAAMCVVYLPIMALHNAFVAPHVGKGIHLFGEMLGMLV